MENKSKNLALTILFFIIIISMIIGGYIYVNKLMGSSKKQKNSKQEEQIDYRINKEKDYIYFENENIISEEPELILKDAVLNIEGADIINSTLKTEMENISKQIVYLNEQNIDLTKTKIYENSNIYSAVEREYYTYKTNKYFSLLIKDLNFNCYEDFKIYGIKSYIIDLTKSKIISNEDLLKDFNLTMDEVKNKVRTHLDEIQTIVEEKEVIKKDETINNIDDTYALYVDNQRLYISYIVKSNFVDYNDSIIIN